MTAQDYLIRLTHPEADRPAEAQVTACSARGAIARVRVAFMHLTGEVEYLTCQADVLEVAPHHTPAI